MRQCLCLTAAITQLINISFDVCVLFCVCVSCAVSFEIVKIELKTACTREVFDQDLFSHEMESETWKRDGNVRQNLRH